MSSKTERIYDRIEGISDSIAERRPNVGFLTGRMLYKFVVVVLLLIIVGIPLVYYLWGSVWSTNPGLTGGHFTLEGYEGLFTERVYDTILNTVIISIGGTVLAVGLGVGLAVIDTKTEITGKRFLIMAVLVQYLLPGFLVAFGWESYASGSGSLINGMLAMIGITGNPVGIYNLFGITLISGLHYAGLVFLLTKSSLASVPASLEEAAQLSGAGKVEITRQITTKLAYPAILISTVLVFVRLMQSFGIPLLLGLREQVYVLATLMYLELQTGFPPNFTFASALGMIILIVSVLGLAIQRRITGVEEKYEIISGGESLKTKTWDLGKHDRTWGVGLFLFAMFAFVLPLLVLVVVSVQPLFVGFTNLQPFTLQHYEALFFGQWSGLFVTSLFNTIIISVVGAFVGMVLASMASYLIIKTDSLSGLFSDYMTLSTAAIPGIIVATAFMWIFLTYNFLGLYGTIWIIMLALTTRFLVYGTRASNSAFRAVDQGLEEAAQINGAGLLTRLRKIYYPLIRPGFFSGFTLLALDYMKVLSIPLLLSGGQQNSVLAVMLWETRAQAKIGVSAAIAVVMIVLIVVGYFTINYLTDVDIEQF